MDNNHKINVKNENTPETDTSKPKDLSVDNTKQKIKNNIPINNEPDTIHIHKENPGEFIKPKKITEQEINAGLKHQFIESPYPHEHYYLNGESAFYDYGSQIVMSDNQASQDDRKVFAALMAAKDNRYMGGIIELTGSEKFEERAIQLIAEYALDLTLKNPKQQKMLEEARTRLKSEPAMSETPPPLGSEASRILKTTPEPDISHLPPEILPKIFSKPEPVNASDKEITAGVTGTLQEHGVAPYNFNRDADNSYFARLRTASGDKILWGKDIRTELLNAGVSIGQIINLKLLGKERVAINVKKKNINGEYIKDKNGELVIVQELVEHNKWQTIILSDISNKTPPGKLENYNLTTWKNLQNDVIKMAQTAGAITPTLPSLPENVWIDPKTGNGVPEPDKLPDRINTPPESPEYGSILFQANDAESRLKILLVQSHGNFLQGFILHQGQYKPVLGKVLKDRISLNEVTSHGLVNLGTAKPFQTENDQGIMFDLHNEKKFFSGAVHKEKQNPILQNFEKFLSEAKQKQQDRNNQPTASARPKI